MNNLILEILPIIETVAKRTTHSTDTQNELIQVTVLKCYDNESTVIRLHEENNLTAWLTTVIWNHYLRLLKTEPIDGKPNDTTDEDYVDMLGIVTHKLSSTERTWLNAYLKDGSYKAISRRANINRRYVSERMKSIIEKCKKLKDI